VVVVEVVPSVDDAPVVLATELDVKVPSVDDVPVVDTELDAEEVVSEVVVAPHTTLNMVTSFEPSAVAKRRLSGVNATEMGSEEPEGKGYEVPELNTPAVTSNMVTLFELALAVAR